MTAAGEVPISEIQVGDLVLAYDEATGATGYYTVTAVISHVDPSLIELTIDGETLETTAEHPFYVMASAPWLATGASQGRWVDAGDLHVGDAVRQADGTTGIVQAVVVVQRSQPMYNLTVAVAHTFFVGEQQWLVHNCGGSRGRLPGPTIDERTGEEVGRFIVDPNGNTMIEPVGGKTVAAGRGGVDTHTLYPNDSNYQRLNPLGHPNNPTPHAHGHLPGTGPGMRGQGPSLDPYGNVVPWASAGAHWPIN
ncbi:MAG: hypothetical protein DYG89_50225 [Caldilinea sp. CFX5]|nr:hypothetical protein [Caldilinea sp. CFX5]